MAVWVVAHPTHQGDYGVELGTACGTAWHQSAQHAQFLQLKNKNNICLHVEQFKHVRKFSFPLKQLTNSVVKSKRWLMQGPFMNLS